MPALVPILAADPWYQDFSFWSLLLAVVGGVATGTWFIARLYFKRLVERAEDDRDRLARELKKPKPDDGRADLERQLADTQDDAARLQGLIDGLNKNLRVVRQMEGLTWRARPTAGAKFVPLFERRTPVVAVLNLKGGVGKTTLTANLGAAFARDGWRVLLVDLDLQASLTSLFLPGEALQLAAQDQRLVQHYLEQSAAGGRPAFLDFVHHTTELRADVVGSADTLAYAELNLTVRWLLQPGKGDPRLLLRDALHGGAAARYNLVLIDCPPLLNVSCVNALAAADFLLVPVMPSKSATDRVRPMLAWVRAIRQNLNPDLKILGVVANRILQSTGMSAPEQNLWAALRDQCHDAWGEPVPMCQTYIPQSTDVRDAESNRRPLRPADRAYESFRRLAAELAERLPVASRPAAESGATA